MKKSLIEQMLLEIAEEERLTLTCTIPQLAYRLSSHHATCSIYGYYFDNNSSAAVEICKDKQACSLLLEAAGIPCIEHKTFYWPQKHHMLPYVDDLEEAFKYAQRHQFRLVCKRPMGAGGAHIYFTENALSFQTALSALLEYRCGICLSPYVSSLYEYRVYVLHQEPQLSYKKVRPYLVGDGTHTIAELIQKKYSDSEPFLANIDPTLFLSQHILAPEEQFVLKHQHNLAQGAKADLRLSLTCRQAIESLAVQATQAVGISFASVDLLQNPQGEWFVLEINPGIAFHWFLMQHGQLGYQKVKELYRKAILAKLQQVTYAGS